MEGKLSSVFAHTWKKEKKNDETLSCPFLILCPFWFGLLQKVDTMRQDHSNRINENVSGCIGVSRPVVILTQRFLYLFLISSILCFFASFFLNPYIHFLLCVFLLSYSSQQLSSSLLTLLLPITTTFPFSSSNSFGKFLTSCCEWHVTSLVFFVLSPILYVFLMFTPSHTGRWKKRRKETEELGTGERKVIITVKKKKKKILCRQCKDEKKNIFFLSLLYVELTLRELAFSCWHQQQEKKREAGTSEENEQARERKKEERDTTHFFAQQHHFSHLILPV